MRETGSLGEALFQRQEPEFRKITPQWTFTNEKKQWIEELADEMTDEMRIGVTASYTRSPPLAPRRRGLPYNDRASEELMRGLRRDISKGLMFLFSFETAGDMHQT